jgi:hypothetical protein
MHLLLHLLSTSCSAVSATSYAMCPPFCRRDSGGDTSSTFFVYPPCVSLSSRWRMASAGRRASAAGLGLNLPLARAALHPNAAGISSTGVWGWASQRQQAVGLSRRRKLEHAKVELFWDAAKIRSPPWIKPPSLPVFATAEFDKYSACRTLGSDSVKRCSGREKVLVVLHTVSSIFDTDNCRAVEMRHGR